MRSRTTWVVLFFVAASLLVATVLDFALTDLFVFFRIENGAILGEGFTLSTLVAVTAAAVAGLYTGMVNPRTRSFIEEVIVELDKVAWPTWADTKVSTFVVVVTSCIAAVILGVFDSVFSWLTANDLFLR